MSFAKPRVLIVTGPPGSGKTTVARSLATRFERGAHLESDRLFHVIAAGYIEPWRSFAHEQNTLIMSVVGDAAASFAKAGYATIVDGILTPGWFLEPVRDSLSALGIEVSLAILRPSIATTPRRRDERHASPIPREIMEQMWNDYAELGPLERHVIENDDDHIDRTVDRVADLWERQA